MPELRSLFLLRLFSARSRLDVKIFGFSGTANEEGSSAVLGESCFIKFLPKSGTFKGAGSHLTVISVRLLHLSV